MFTRFPTWGVGLAFLSAVRHRVGGHRHRRALSADPNWIGFTCDVLPSGLHRSRTTRGSDVSPQCRSRWDPLRWRKCHPVVGHSLHRNPRPESGSPWLNRSESDPAHADVYFQLADGREVRCRIPVPRRILFGSILPGESRTPPSRARESVSFPRFRSRLDRSSVKILLVPFPENFIILFL